MNRLDQALQDFLSLDDASLREEYLIEKASTFRGVPEDIAERPYPETALVPGCESRAYFFPREAKNGHIEFYFAIENPHGISAKALAVLLTESLSGESAETIETVSPEVVHSLFGPSLSMGKNQGLRNMVLLLRESARRSRLTGTSPR